MSDVVLHRRQILAIMEGNGIESRFSNYEDRAFMPATLMIDVIEKEKKGGSKIPSQLRFLIDNIPECVSLIPLSSQGLYSAMDDPDFSGKFSNREGNPIEFATEASAYEYDGWWDKAELLNSIHELSWL